MNLTQISIEKIILEYLNYKPYFEELLKKNYQNVDGYYYKQKYRNSISGRLYDYKTDFQLGRFGERWMYSFSCNPKILKLENKMYNKLKYGYLYVKD